MKASVLRVTTVFFFVAFIHRYLRSNECNNGNFIDVSSQVGAGSLFGLTFSPDGTMMFVNEKRNNYSIYKLLNEHCA